MPWVKKRRAAVKCHQKLELSLENQHSKLQKTLEELRAYQKQHERWAKMNSNVNSVQAPLENRVASRQSYERFTFMTEGNAIYRKFLLLHLVFRENCSSTRLL